MIYDSSFPTIEFQVKQWQIQIQDRFNLVAIYYVQVVFDVAYPKQRLEQVKGDNG